MHRRRHQSSPSTTLSLRTLGLPTILALAVGLTACPDGGEFTPEEPDAGPGVVGITAADIGVPCTYTAGTNQNPTNQCRTGLECVMVTRDLQTGFTINPLGLDTMVVYEDQLTVFLDDRGSAEGYCTLVGNAAAPPACPTGTITKLFTSTQAAGGFAAACLKPCQASAECSGNRVCDNRYFDDFQDGIVGFCVRPCEFEFPDCVRTGVGVANQQGQLATQLFAGDLGGGQVCNQQSGICEDNGTAGLGDDGAPCTSSADCVDGAGCIQSDTNLSTLSTGYCARRCFVDNNSFPNGSCGDERCQPGMTFGLQFIPTFDPGGVYGTAPQLDEGSAVRALNGLCFDPCIEGFDCPTQGTVCGPEVDAAVIGGAWNTVAMCVPPDLQLDP